MLPVGALVAQVVAILSLMALCLSTRFPPRLSLMGCAFLAFLGLLAEWLGQQSARSAPFLRNAVRLLPNWQDFWLADVLAGQGQIPWIYVGWASLYALLLMAGALAFGCLLFRNADIS